MTRRAGMVARLRPDSTWRATAWFAALTTVMTWPLVTGLTHDVPSDLGDPLLNAWILAWNLDHLLRALSGDVTALGAIWHANIFHPAPYVLAYSELLFTESAIALPIYAVTRNILLSYNLLFLAAFVLSGVGMYLFVKALTGDWRAAFVSGLIYAFTPYRLDQAPHLQVMWSCWMPFVFLGIRRYFDEKDRTGLEPDLTAVPALGPSSTGRSRWTDTVRPASYLAGAALALLAQNLSCGYYMLFFPPFVALYALYELVSRGLHGDWRSWLALALTGAAAALVTLPFMLPYFALREGGQSARGMHEISAFSADSYAYLTAHANHRLWSWLDMYPRAEGHLFPGAMPVILTLLGVGAALVLAVRVARTSAGRPAHADGDAPRRARTGRDRVRHAVAVFMFVATVFWSVVLVGLFFGLEGRYELGPIEVRLFSVIRPFAYGVATAVLTLVLSARARNAATALVRTHVVWAAAVAGVAAWLSMGPLPTVLGDSLREATIYPLLYQHVPGYDGLRVPARFAMIVMLALAWAASAGYLALVGRLGTRVFPLVCGLALVDAAAFPIPMNGQATSDTFIAPPATVPVTAPRLARAIDTLPADAVLLELPFGDISWEIRYVYLSMFHWRSLVNGYSGHFPPHYLALRAALAGLPDSAPPQAWPMLASSGTTHIIVHSDALGPERTPRMREWLESHGARLLLHVDGSYLYAR